MIKVGLNRSKIDLKVREDGKYAGAYESIALTARLMDQLACKDSILVSESVWEAVQGEKQAGEWKGFGNRRIKSFEEGPMTVYERLWDGASKGEPGEQWLPNWYSETNKYISRPKLEMEIGELFAEKTTNGYPCRMVTLHGFGGMGKTRLAYQAALEMTGVFKNRNFIARLGDITTDNLLPTESARRDYLQQTLMKAFGIPNEPPVTVEELPGRIRAILHTDTGEPALLLLDNWETVRGKESQILLKQVLDACPDLRVLATGRERVSIDGYEQPCLIQGLGGKGGGGSALRAYSRQQRVGARGVMGAIGTRQTFFSETA